MREGRCSRCPDKVVYIGEISKPATPGSSNTTVTIEILLQLNSQQCQEVQSIKNMSWMWEYTWVVHNVGGYQGGKLDYLVKVRGRFRKCLREMTN